MKVFVDMDGVLADFFSSAMQYSHVGQTTWRDLEMRDADKIIEKVRKNENFFCDLKPYPMTNTVIRIIKNLFGEYSILTAPLKDYQGNCSSEKRKWIQNNLIDKPNRIIVDDDKIKYARGNILIDDYKHTIAQWERAGGFGIHWQADRDKLSELLLPLQMLAKST